jgi:hypothetical protein
MSNSNLTDRRRGRDRTEPDETDVDHATARANDSDRFVYREWLLFAPLAIATAYVPLVVVLGQDVLDTGQGGLAGARALALLALFLVVSVEATVHLFDDATRGRKETDWHPNPWLYIVVCGLVVTGALVGRYILLDIPITRPIPFVGGTVIVGLAMSSVLAGPVYAYRRRKKA